ncbi:MAG TPA: type IA DNA topoisomerase [Flavobacteriia bacterium]|nr:type IA DNA topoisomerase [Flavobacteriia bacterium]
MKVCIAEKPSVAREIAQVLGANTKRDGYFEGNGYAVTYTFGHLCTLLEPKDYKPHWKSWNLNNLPMLPEKFQTKVTDDSGIKKQFQIIKNLFSQAEIIINCGDAGQEGELIQRWVINQAGYNGKVQRLWISSLTTEAIKQGFNNLKPAADYDNLYYAGFSRAICDWLLGLNATRLYTVKYGGFKQVLSVGRVQTPTLAMLVKRFREIENFTPQKYWELQTVYRNTLFNYEEGRFFKKEDGEKVAEEVKKSDLEITNISKKKGKEYAPKLFDLTGLQVYCNNKFGFTADETLKIVQKLYEMKVVTYPRVDTTFLPNDMYPKVKGILQNLNNYASLTQPLLAKKIRKSTKVFNDKKVTDHHAIIPTGVQTKLAYNQQQVYDIITLRFIAVFYEDCEISRTNVTAKAGKVPFKTSGKEILKKGWRVVFETEATSDTSTEKDILPNFVKGEKGPHQPTFTEKETKPPRHFTEATLLRAMETAGKQVNDEQMRELMKENGIGRPSTRASIIETLFRRKYITRNKKQLLPTQTGLQLIETIKNPLLKSAKLTGQWEKKLKEIERGEHRASTFINSMKKMVDQLVYEVRTEQVTTRISAENKPKIKEASKINTNKGIVNKTCPKCENGKILKGKTAFGCSNYKNGCDLVLPFTFKGRKISENQYMRLLDKGETLTLKGFQTESGKVNAKVVLDTAGNLQLQETLSDKVKNICPKCKKGNIIKGRTAFGCSNYKNGCDFVISFATVQKKANGKTLTKELVAQILQGKIVE